MKKRVSMRISEWFSPTVVRWIPSTCLHWRLEHDSDISLLPASMVKKNSFLGLKNKAAPWKTWWFESIQPTQASFFSYYFCSKYTTIKEPWTKTAERKQLAVQMTMKTQQCTCWACLVLEKYGQGFVSFPRKWCKHWHNIDYINMFHSWIKTQPPETTVCFIMCFWFLMLGSEASPRLSKQMT